jgi:hypothetical protein
VVHPVNYSGVGVLGLCLANDPMLHSVCDRTRMACVRSQVMYTNVCECVWPEAIERRGMSNHQRSDAFDHENHL